MNEVNKVEEMSVIATIEIKNDQMVSPSRLFQFLTQKISDGEVVLEKRANANGKFWHLINGKILGCQDFHNRLEAYGIQSTNSFNFCLQNSIKKLANLPKAGLLDVLSEVIGTKVFDKNKQTVMLLMDKSESVD